MYANECGSIVLKPRVTVQTVNIHLLIVPLVKGDVVSVGSVRNISSDCTAAAAKPPPPPPPRGTVYIYITPY
jgi:hypothetical protein